jgi:hypothetical protein
MEKKGEDAPCSMYKVARYLPHDEYFRMIYHYCSEDEDNNRRDFPLVAVVLSFEEFNKNSMRCLIRRVMNQFSDDNPVLLFISEDHFSEDVKPYFKANKSEENACFAEIDCDSWAKRCIFSSNKSNASVVGKKPMNGLSASVYDLVGTDEGDRKALFEESSKILFEKNPSEC